MTERIRIRVSKPSGSGYAVHWSALIAQRTGLYAAENLDVDLVELDQDAGTAALLGGDVPVMRRGPDETIALIARGAPLRVIAALVTKSPIALFATPDVNAIADLRGRTIAGISARFGSSLVLRLLLDDEGLPEAGYAIVHVGGTGERFRALQDGRAAAAVLSPPTDRDAERAGFTPLANLATRYPNFLFSAIQVQCAYAERCPDAVVRLLKADIRAQQRLCDPRYKNEAIALLAEADRIELTAATAAYESMVERDRLFSPDCSIAPADAENLLAAMVRFGDVPDSLRVRDCFDPSYLDEAQRQLAVLHAPK